MAKVERFHVKDGPCFQRQHVVRGVYVFTDDKTKVNCMVCLRWIKGLGGTRGARSNFRRSK